ncbi:MAG: cyclic peptide export ABC transporter [Verrucomicrobia bacterium]|nr:cyclic peptide export ABC transporter [Verrucomicrobiota bacterium]
MHVNLRASLLAMKLWRILARYGGWRLLAAIVAGLGAGLALAALMRLIHRALTLPADAAGSAALEFVGLLLAYLFGTLIAQQSLNDAAERLQWELRLRLLRQALAAPLRQLERTGFPRLMTLLGSDVRQLADYLCGLPDSVVNLAIAVGCFVYMAWLSPPVFVFNVVFIALAAACYLVPERAAQRIYRRAATAWDKHIGQLTYALQGLRSLLLSRPRRRDFVEGHFGPTGGVVREFTRRSRFIHVLAERGAEAMVLGNVACLLFVLPRFVDLPIATTTGLLLAAIFARQPLKDSLDILPRTQRARVAIDRMHEAGLDPFVETPPEPLGPAPGENGEFRELALEQVTFRYEPDHEQSGFACGPFTFRIRAGEIVFVVGGNGSGKTTLAKLLCGLYPPESGRILLDGQPITDEAGRAGQRARFAAVFPGDPLFEHVLGRAPAEAEQRGGALLRELRLDHKVVLRGTEFSTTDLSQGQRRRLVLLGALLEERPVLLLDEWAADQDPEFRIFFYDQIVPELRARGRTLILITHDDRYFNRADRVLKLEGGALVDNGAA